MCYSSKVPWWWKIRSSAPHKGKSPHRSGVRRAPENLPILDTVRMDLPKEQAGLAWIRDEVSYEQELSAQPVLPSRVSAAARCGAVYVHSKKLLEPRIAAMPVRVIPQSMVGPSFLAHMLVSK